MKKQIILTAILFLTIAGCEEHHKDPKLRGEDNELCVSEAIWSHPLGDLQNTGRARELREKECFEDTVKGEIAWSTPLGAAGTNAAPVIASDGTIYIHGEYPGSPFGAGHRNAGLMAFSSSGSLKWFFPTPVYFKVGLGYHYGQSVALGKDETIYFAWDSVLYAIKPDGTLKWKYSTIALVNDDTSFSDKGFPDMASPVIDKNGYIYTGGSDSIYCFYPSGKIRWMYALPKLMDREACTSISLSPNKIICGLWLTGILALDYSGKKEWLYEVNFNDYGSQYKPIIDEEGNIYFKINANSIISIDRHGTRRWGGAVGIAGGMTRPVIRGDYLYFTTALGGIFRMNKDTGIDPEVIGETHKNVDEGFAPVINDRGVLYVFSGDGGTGTTSEVVAIDTKTLTQLWTFVFPGATLFEGGIAMDHLGRIVAAGWEHVNKPVNKLYVIK